MKMAALLFITFFIAIFALGTPIYAGFTKLNILSSILWAFAATVYAVGTGWRSANSGWFKSGALGFICGLIVFVPLYFVGYLFS